MNKKILSIIFIILSIFAPHIYTEKEEGEISQDFLLDLIKSYLNSGNTKGAVELLNRLNSLYPENYDVRLWRGVAFLIEKDYERAFEELKKVEDSIEASKRIESRPLSGFWAQKEKITFSPKNYGLLYFARGLTLLIYQKDFKSAKEKFYSAIKEGYDGIEVRYLLIYTLIKLKEYEKASQELNNLVKLKNRDEIDYFIEGFLSYHKGKFEDSLSSFKKALDIDPEFVEAKKNIGYIYYNNGQYEKAIEILRKIVEKVPGDSELKLNIARSYFHMGRMEEAKREYEKLNLSIPIEKYSPKIINLLFITPDRWIKFNFVSEVDYKALYTYGVDPQKIKDRRSKSIILLTLNEKALFIIRAEGKIEEAIKILNFANQIDRTSFFINYNLGQLYFIQGDKEKAKMHALQSIHHKPNFFPAYDLLGSIYFEEGRYRDALEEFKKVVEISKTDAQGYYNLGCTYWALKEWDKAEEAWKKAIIYDSKIFQGEKEEKFIQDGLSVSLIIRKSSVAYRAYISLAILYEEKGLVEDAIKAYEKAMEIEPANPEAYFELGRIYFNLKSYEKARFYLEKHINLGGLNQEKAKKLLDSLK